MSQPEMRCSERDETEGDIPQMDLLDRWESPHKIQDSREADTVTPFGSVFASRAQDKLFRVGVEFAQKNNIVLSFNIM